MNYGVLRHKKSKRFCVPSKVHRRHAKCTFCVLSVDPGNIFLEIFHFAFCGRNCVGGPKSIDKGCPQNGPYCRWTRVRNAIAWRKTQNEKFRKFFSLGPPTTRKMYILRRFWVDQVLRRRKKYDFSCRRWTCRRTQYIRINLGRKTGFASTQKAFGSTQKVFGQRKRFLVNAKAFWVNANSFWTSVRTKYLYHKFVYIFVYF